MMPVVILKKKQTIKSLFSSYLEALKGAWIIKTERVELHRGYFRELLCFAFVLIIFLKSAIIMLLVTVTLAMIINCIQKAYRAFICLL